MCFVDRMCSIHIRTTWSLNCSTTFTVILTTRYVNCATLAGCSYRHYKFMAQSEKFSWVWSVIGLVLVLEAYHSFSFSFGSIFISVWIPFLVWFFGLTSLTLLCCLWLWVRQFPAENFWKFIFYLSRNLLKNFFTYTFNYNHTFWSPALQGDAVN